MLKDLIQEKHRQAEQMPFNQRMFRGELSIYEYSTYLQQLEAIFAELEKNPLPHPSLNRTAAIQQDIQELGYNRTIPLLEASKHYTRYLATLSADEQLPHVYLHYMALLFGGQIMKNKIHGNGTLYQFDDAPAAIQAIRTIQQDSWANEANRGLDYFTDILDELYDLFRLHR